MGAAACGECVMCLDMPRFGGPGVIRQGCLARRARMAADAEATSATMPDINEASRDPRKRNQLSDGGEDTDDEDLGNDTATLCKHMLEHEGTPH